MIAEFNHIDQIFNPGECLSLIDLETDSPCLPVEFGSGTDRKLGDESFEVSVKGYYDESRGLCSDDQYRVRRAFGKLFANVEDVVPSRLKEFSDAAGCVLINQKANSDRRH